MIRDAWDAFCWQWVTGVAFAMVESQYKRPNRFCEYVERLADED